MKMIQAKSRIFVLFILALMVMAHPAHAWKLESDSVALPATTGMTGFHSVSFRQAYPTPPVVVAIASNEGSDPASLRIRNVTTTGFEMIQVEPRNNDGPHISMTVHYIAVEPGVHVLPDGTLIEAGTHATTSLQGGTNQPFTGGWDNILFSAPFNDAPAVLTQIQSLNNETNAIPDQTSTPWITAAVQGITQGGFSVALERSEVADGATITSSESIGYIAISGNAAGQFTDAVANTILYESILTREQVQGWSDGCFNIAFTNTYSSVPLAVASKTTRLGDNGGWFRRCGLSTSALGLATDEDIFLDSERTHIAERAAVLVFSQAFHADLANAALPPLPAHAYKLDECTWRGNPILGEVLDTNGGQHGTAYNGVSTAAGKICGGGEFNTSDTDDYMQLPAAVIDGAHDFSVSVWIKTTRTGQQSILSGARNGQDNAWLLFMPNSSQISTYINGGALTFNTGNLADDQWHLVVWTRSNRLTSLYVDGNLKGSGNQIPATINVTSLIVGQEQDSVGGSFDSGQIFAGSMDELAFYNLALSAAQVAQLHSQQDNGKNPDGGKRICNLSCPLLLAEFTLDSCSWAGDNTVFDSSGNDNNGTAVGGADTTEGKVCKAGHFDGGNDKIIGTWNETIDDSVTLMAWFKSPGGGGSNPRLIEFSSLSGSYTDSTALAYDRDGSLRGWVTSSNGNRYGEIDYSTELYTDDAWHHAAYVYDGQEARLYIDGVLKQSAVSPNPTGDLRDARSFVIGGYYPDNLNGFNGNIDEVRIYKGALTSTDISEVMNRSHACRCAQATTAYRFDECTWGTGTNTILDSIGSLHGTAFNGTNPASGGKICSMGSFNTTDTNDYIVLPASAVNGKQDFSFSVWIRSSRSGAQSVISGAGPTSDNAWLLFMPNGNQLATYLGSNNTYNTPGLANGNWHHIVWARAGSIERIFIDGVQQLPERSARSDTQLNVASLMLGQEQDSIGGSFDINQIFSGEIDELRFYDTALDATQVASLYANQNTQKNDDGSTRICLSCSALDHLSISHSGTGITCEAEPVVISGHNSTHGSFSIPGGSVLSLGTSTNRGDWVLATGTGSLNNGIADDGIATYTVGAAGETSITFKLQHTVAGMVNINVNNSGVTELASEDPSLVFDDVGFRFYADGANNMLGTQIAGKASSIAPGNQLLTLRAVKTSTDTGACEALLQGPQTIQMAYECRDPASCTSGEFLNVNGSNIAANNAGSLSAYANVAMNFDTGGESVLVQQYSDAGRIRLHALHTIPAQGENPAVTLNGSSNEFIVRPFGFFINVPGNPGSLNDTGAAFTRAGQNFTANVTAIGWQAADDADANGIPDGYADNDPANNANLADNRPTPNFGNETAPATIQLSGSHVHPAIVNGGSTGTLSIGINNLNASNGTASFTDTSYSEVGVIELLANSTDYFGSLPVSGRSGGVGRFIPDHFTVLASTLDDRVDLAGCADPFNYMGENLELQFTLQARNTAGIQTRNYEAGTGYDYSKLVLGSGLNFGAINDPAGTPSPLTSRIVLASVTGTFSDGSAAITARMNISRALTPDGPFPILHLGINPLDADAVGLNPGLRDLDPAQSGSNTHHDLATTDIRFGRVQVVNANGSELLPLTIPVRAEYLAGGSGGFIINTSDTCTRMDMSDQPGTIDWSSPPSSYLAPLTSANINTTDIVTLSAGVGQFTLHDNTNPALGPGVTGAVDYTITVPAYLRFDWDGNTIYDNNPGARASFGRYSGSPRWIYMRELY